MPTKRLLPILALFVVVLLASGVYAQVSPPPRTAPPNDNFANATPIVFGKDYKAHDIGEATNEVGESGVSCNTNQVIPNTVWYTFSLSRPAIIHLSTDGTQLFSPIYDSYDTVMAIFTGSSINALTEVACVDDSTTVVSHLNFTPTAGVTYHVVVGTFDAIDWDASSLLKFDTRLIQVNMQPDNYDFEQPLSNDNWKLKSPSGDALICSNVLYPAQTGLCAFKFSGNADESSSLSQSTPLMPGFVPRKHAIVSVYGVYRVMNTASLGKAKISLTALYSDSTPPSTRTLNLAGISTMPGYQSVVLIISLASSKVDALKIKISFKSTSGVLLVDSFQLYYEATAATRDSGPLPLPASAR